MGSVLYVAAHPNYRICRKGELAEQRGDIRDVWRDDLVAFLLGWASATVAVTVSRLRPGMPVNTPMNARRHEHDGGASLSSTPIVCPRGQAGRGSRRCGAPA
jgi:hypothetical protein